MRNTYDVDTPDKKVNHVPGWRSGGGSGEAGGGNYERLFQYSEQQIVRNMQIVYHWDSLFNNFAK